MSQSTWSARARLTGRWGLRDYGTGLWDGGDPDCDHKTRERGEMKADVASKGYNPGSNFANYQAGYESGDTFKDVCGKCGATHVDQQLGLEPTPEQYVANMVDVFREVRRVLRRDGTCWVNLGDTYNSRLDGSHGGWNGSSPNPQRTKNDGATQKPQYAGKPKDLVGIPWRVAFALQADGWYLRSDIIWSKPNPMPESVTDRPTKAHEYVFLLTRSPRYFFDAEAVREAYAPASEDRYRYAFGGKKAEALIEADKNGMGVRTRTVGMLEYHGPTREPDPTLDGSDGEAPRGPDGRRATHVQGADGSLQHRDGERWPNGGRNIRSVWEIATEPFSARALGGDNGRTTSPDCPVHGVRRRPVSAVPDDEPQGVSDSPHTRNSDDRPAREPVAAPDATEPSPGEDPESESSATPHNSGMSRTAGQSEPHGTAAAPLAADTAYTSTPPALFATSDHTRESKSAAGSVEGEPDSDPSAQTLSRTAGSSCTCKYTDHFAVFPTALVSRCIKAGTSERGCCPECGAPWERLTTQDRVPHWKGGHKGMIGGTARGGVEDKSDEPRTSVVTTTTGWAPSCDHYYHTAPAVPCTVLDPFMGSGTVALVARRLGRRSIGIELNPEYAALCARRLQQLSLFAGADA
jgi:DNA modification methylase